MSWMQKLYETYNNCQSMIGVESNDKDVPLLPICHTTQKVQIEIIIDGNGNFRRARVIPKEKARTIIPCTEKSGGRTSGEAPHPLCDKLQYIAVDYPGKKPYSASFISRLEEWCGSEFSDHKAIAVLNYIKKGNVIRDLIDHQVLITGEDGKLLPKWDKKKDKNVPKIFEVLSSQESAFIRWEVEIQGIPESKVWRDKTLWDKWIHYYSATKKEKMLCYVTGEKALTADQHLAKLRNDGDKAKIISSNDSSGFTFRGRFLSANQAAGMGLETTQKAHHALRWLISRQGYRRGGLAIVAWATSGTEIPQPPDDPISILDTDDLISDEPSQVATAQDLAIKLKKKIAGYGLKIGNTMDVVVMGLDSATTGRMAVTYYRELKGSDYLERINDWHETCSWLHRYRSIEAIDQESGKVQKRYPPFVGAPAPSDIAEAAYGKRVDDKLRKKTVERILPCIIDGQSIPRDIVESVVRKASNRVALEDWQWNKTLSIACALYKKYKEEKENYDMALDENRTTRPYLYGRLLAIADRLEEVALYKAKKKRATTATRYMQQFSQHPYRTWNQIHSSLIPYMVQLDGAFFYKNLIAEVKTLFTPEDFINDKPLTGEYLLGYYSQRQELLPKKKDKDEDKTLDE